MWLTILARYWKPLAIVAVSALAFVYVRHLGVTATEAKYKPIVAAANLARDQAQADLAAEQAAFKHAQEISSDYQKQLAALRITASAPPPVSLRCRATKAGVPVEATAGGRSGTASGDGVLPQENGFDIADPTIPLEQLADEADQLSERLRACQAFNR